MVGWILVWCSSYTRCADGRNQTTYSYEEVTILMYVCAQGSFVELWHERACQRKQACTRARVTEQREAGSVHCTVRSNAGEDAHLVFMLAFFPLGHGGVHRAMCAATDCRPPHLAA